ncbi:MAG: precorrin-6A reductase [Tissierella sp.]|uniref:precorrin-6A reductase n=1 Tax=Tissierella sp. TaxID=41274 RepID=UPI003F963667
MIWIIGGTSEARLLVEKIKDKDNFIVTVATETGKEFIKAKNLKVGRMTVAQMDSFIKEKSINVLIDLSHPYAKIVSENAKAVAKNNKIEYIRYMREKTDYKDIIELASYEDTCEYLKNIKGTVFFTTGSKNIDDFEDVRGENRFIYRVLPAPESIGICKKNSVKLKDIVALLGPFSYEMNKLIFKEYGADYVVMKDSGSAGGTIDKIKACKELKINAIVISREEETGVKSLKDLEDIIRQKY